MLPEIRDSSEVYGVTSGVFDHPVPVAALIGDQQAALFGQTCFDAGNVKHVWNRLFPVDEHKERPIHSHTGSSAGGWRIRGRRIMFWRAASLSQELPYSGFATA